MYKEHFLDHPLLPLALLSMALFAIAFGAIVVRAALAKKDDLNRAAALPLRDDPNDAGDAP